MLNLALGLIALPLLYFFIWMTLAISWKITMVQKAMDRRGKGKDSGHHLATDRVPIHAATTNLVTGEWGAICGERAVEPISVDRAKVTCKACASAINQLAIGEEG